MITPEQLKEWRKLCEEACGGPWELRRYRDTGNATNIVGHCRKDAPHGCAEEADEHTGACGEQTDVVTTDSGVYTHDEADLRFIAASRSALPILLDELEEARRVVDGMRYGEDGCWCEVSIGNPNFGGSHSPACRAARKFLEGK